MQNLVNVFYQDKYNVEEIASKIEPLIPEGNYKNIFVKPNMVIDPWKGEEENWVATVTHPSIIEAVLLVLKKRCRGVSVTIGDAPMARSNHHITLRKLKIDSMIKKYACDDFQISLIDIREWYWKYVGTMCVSRKKLPGDPLGVKMVNLYGDSAFASKENKNYEAFDDINPVSDFHNEVDNIFSVSASILNSDLFINLPKMKTHRIAGMTCAMKNLVGVNSNKNCVPHNTSGLEDKGGDTGPSDNRSYDEQKGIGGLARKILRKKNPIINYCIVPLKLVYDKLRPSTEKIGYGMWYGNDTIWRSIVDLNRIILYCDKEGKMQHTPQRKYVCITDAVVSGEGEGPLHPTPKTTNLLFVAENMVANDLFAATVMGFDYGRIPSIKNALNSRMRWNLVDFDYSDLKVIYADETYEISNLPQQIRYSFVPTSGWKNHIET